jgi:hypothetical protein
VQISEGNFEAREVETGLRLGDRVQIVKGLEGDETLASAGTFLIDSEGGIRMSASPSTTGKVHSTEQVSLHRIDGGVRP